MSLDRIDHAIEKRNREIIKQLEAKQARLNPKYFVSPGYPHVEFRITGTILDWRHIMDEPLDWRLAPKHVDDALLFTIVHFLTPQELAGRDPDESAMERFWRDRRFRAKLGMGPKEFIHHMKNARDVEKRARLAQEIKDLSMVESKPDQTWTEFNQYLSLVERDCVTLERPGTPPLPKK